MTQMSCITRKCFRVWFQEHPTKTGRRKSKTIEKYQYSGVFYVKSETRGQVYSTLQFLRSSTDTTRHNCGFRYYTVVTATYNMPHFTTYPHARRFHVLSSIKLLSSL